MRSQIKTLIEHRWFTRIIIALILINAVILGLETYPNVMAKCGEWLVALDRAILWIFVIEITLKLLAYGGRFFRDPWNLFDLTVVGVAFLPASETFSVLRAIRVLRVLRLISAFPRLRRVVQGLLHAVPGIGSIGAILVILYYIFAVMATKLYGGDYPSYFGSLQTSLFTLFQIMTLEGWAEIVRDILVTHPNAWIFFVIYILIATFTVLNLFIAVIVDAMQKQNEEEAATERQVIAQMQKDIFAIRNLLEKRK